MRRLSVSISFGVGLLIAAAALAYFQPTLSTEQIMRRKLGLGQNLLAGVALEDFAAIERDAKMLGQLGELAAWNVLRTAEYAQRTADFRRTTDALAKGAQERSLDAATQAYVEMTLQCVQCHKYLRGTRRASTR